MNVLMDSGKLVLDKTKNAKKGIVTGVVNKVVTLLVPFIVRTVFIQKVGMEYAGLNSLFASTIQILNLAELGFSSAVIFSMYKPIADKDNKTICALLNFYRDVYRLVGLVVFIVGLILMLFLDNLINGEKPADVNIYIVYFIFLTNSCISYLLYGYKTSLFYAFQRTDVINNIGSITQIGLSISQLIILFAFKNYYYYLVLIPLFTILNNLLVSYWVDRMYPQYRCNGRITKRMRLDIWKRISGLAIYRICVMTRNSLSSIVLSVFLSLTIVGIYDNYYMILNALTGMMLIITNSMLGGIGNAIETKSKEENFKDLCKFNFIYVYIGSISAIMLTTLYQPFMTIWMGKDYLLPFSTVSLLGLYFFNLKLGDILNVYYSAAGLWWYGKWRSIMELISNVILSIVLVQLFGIDGVIFSTVAVHFFINLLYGMSIAFKHYFGTEFMRKFYKLQFYYLIVTVLSFLICYYILCTIESILVLNNPWHIMIERVIVCLCISSTLLFLFYFNTIEYKNSISWIKSFKK